jgi:dethiobiotin synthetase
VDESGTTLMKELVRPASEVLDYRTHLTGVTAADLEGVSLTRKAVAKRIAALLTPATVLVVSGLGFVCACVSACVTRETHTQQCHVRPPHHTHRTAAYVHAGPQPPL